MGQGRKWCDQYFWGKEQNMKWPFWVKLTRVRVVENTCMYAYQKLLGRYTWESGVVERVLPLPQQSVFHVVSGDFSAAFFHDLCP